GISLIVFLGYIFFYDLLTKFVKYKTLFKRNKDFLKAVFIASTISFFILLPQLFPAIKSYFDSSEAINISAYNPQHRPFEDLFNQSAKPLGYLLPSTEHPIFGGFTKRFVGSPLWGASYTEHQLYLGWTTILLTLYAIKIWRKKRKAIRIKDQMARGEEELKEDFYIGFFIFFVIVAWLFSQPPWWQLGKFKILLPSFFMYKVLPMFRAYCRFGIVVLLAMAVLAGYGLKFVMERQRSKIKRGFIGVFCCGLILFEFWHNPMTHYIDLSKYPAVYDWLEEQEGDVVIVEYPMIKDGVNEKYKFYQTIHHKKLINGAAPGMSGYQVKLQILDLGAPKTPFILDYLGADYAIVHTGEYKESEDYSRYSQYEKIRNHPDLKLIKSFPDGIEVYRIK
ncbi:MAG: hypothetical protein P9L98_05495, partial [Candidatus Kaelpia imicola]|nr:hypothetical protein [Candidatus Kaelpia imicola]